MSTPAPLDEVQKPPLARLRLAAPKLGASLLIAGGFVYVFNEGGLPMIPNPELLRAVRPWAVVGYVVLYAAAMLLRPYRWIHLVRPIAPTISTPRVFGVGLVGFMAVFFAPLRMGEIVRPWLLASDRDVTFLQATGTVAAERIIDGLVLTSFLITCLLCSQPLPNLPDHLGKLALPVSAVPDAAYLSCAAFAVALSLMALFYRWRALARQFVRGTVGLLSPKLAEYLSVRVERLSDGFKFLRSRSSALFLRDTGVFWLLSAIATWTLLRGSGVDASFAEAGVVLGVMGIGSLIPSGPGFFGTYQLAVYLGLAMFFQESMVFGAGAVFAFVSYCVQLALTLLSGLAGAVILAKTAPSGHSDALELGSR